MQSPLILDLMSQQIAAERETALSDAREQAAEVKRSADARAAKRRHEMIAAVDHEVGELGRRARERAEAEAEMVILTTKDTVTNEILDRVQLELARIAASDKFGAVLEALLAELMPEAPADGVVLVPAAHEAQCRKWLDKHGHKGYAIEARKDLTDGVAVQDKDHTFRITNTLSARFQQLESSLRKYCVSELFGEGSAHV